MKNQVHILSQSLVLFALLSAIGSGQERATTPDGAIAVRSIELKTLGECSRVVICLTAAAPHRLLYRPGDREAVVELTGVTTQGFSPRGSYFDPLVSGIWVSEPAALSATVRIVLNAEAKNVRSFGLSQLPGIIVDVDRGAGAGPSALVFPPATETPAASQPVPGESSSRPAVASAKPALPGDVPPGVLTTPAHSAPEAVPAEFVELPPLAAPSAPVPEITIGPRPEAPAGPTGDPADFPEDRDHFPIGLATPQSEAGREILAAYNQADYEEAVKRSWAFFEAAANSGDHRDELPALALAAESRYQYERVSNTPNFEEPLNYYRQLRRLAPEGPLKTFAAYRIGQCLLQTARFGQAQASFSSAFQDNTLPFDEDVGLQAAALQLDARDFEEAETILRVLAARHPASARRAETQARLGDALFGQERWEEARQAYRQALELDSSLAETKSAYRLGCADEALNRMEEAYQVFQRFSAAASGGPLTPEEIDRGRLRAADYCAGDGYLEKKAPENDVQRGMSDLVALAHNYEGRPLGIEAALELAVLGIRHRAQNAMLPAWEDVPEYVQPLQVVEALGRELRDPKLAVEISRELVGMARRNLREGGLDDIRDTLLDALMMTTGEAFEGDEKTRNEISLLLAEAIRGYYEADRPLEGARLFKRSMEHIPLDDQPELNVYYGALCFLAIGAADEAIAYLALLENSAEDSAVPPDAVQFHLAEAEYTLARQSGAPRTKALDRLQKILGEHSDTPLRSRVLFLIGRCLADGEENEMAAQALEQALALPGLLPQEQIEGYRTLGDADAALGRRDRALEAYTRGLYLFEDQRVAF
ncbi:MAG: tetratricopeptide repeat protein, partial [Candidatus Sumerlaeota bacterium]|nr:tetratricopeptide repeat protein [Candidatus Sumerlaeota bacterium]